MSIYVSMVLHTTHIHRNHIIQVGMIRKIKKQGNGFIELFMSFILGRKYQMALKFIIKTLIGIIMSFLIWLSFQKKNIVDCIKNGLKRCGKEKRCKKQAKEVEKNVKNGIIATKVENGIQNTKKNTSKRFKLLKYARNAVANLIHLKIKDTRYFVGSAVINSLNVNCEKKQRVYNIKVENGMYFANNILVSNCDMMSMALNIAYRKQPLKVAMGWDEASESIENDYY